MLEKLLEFIARHWWSSVMLFLLMLTLLFWALMGWERWLAFPEEH